MWLYVVLFFLGLKELLYISSFSFIKYIFIFFIAQLKVSTNLSSCVPLLPAHQPVVSHMNSVEHSTSIETSSHERLIAHQPASNHAMLQAPAISHAAISEVSSQTLNDQLLPCAPALPISILGM